MVEDGSSPAQLPDKMATGIRGFDGISGGGLPRGRLSLVTGGPGAGKTVFAMQSLVHGARVLGEPGLLLTFEERPQDLVANFQGFDWGVQDLLDDGRLSVIDARLSPEAVISGQFDLSGLLAGVGARASRLGVRRVVFDGLDVLLSLLDDPRLEMRQLFDLDRWLRGSGLTGLITGKLDGGMPDRGRRHDMAQYVVDCAVTLDVRVEDRLATRDVRIVKYRGNAFPSNRYPLVMTPHGIEVFFEDLDEMRHQVFTDRLSSGIPRLDVMLGGGLYRGTSILVSGAPGTAKTTLAGAMVDATCRAGERCLFLSFDEAADQIVRNLASVGLDLATHRANGLLLMAGLRANAAAAEAHIHHLHQMIEVHRPSLVVIDPVSALLKGGWRWVVDAVVQGVLDHAKTLGITTFLTALVTGSRPDQEVTDTHISTMADTWIHLSYVPHGGERNRALTVVKSRGSAHSNQVRELVLSHDGLTLADVYLSEGEVLMGTARLEREAANRERLQGQVWEEQRQRTTLDTRLAALRAQQAALDAEIAQAQAEAGLLCAAQRQVRDGDAQRRAAVRVSRQADPASPDPVAVPPLFVPGASS